MTKPPKSSPHSDIEGVHQDERSNIETANEAGQDAGDLEKVRKDRKGKPPYSDDLKNRDDRTG